MSWEFPSRQVVEALHAEQLRRHGGAQGLRDENALVSALHRAENKTVYGEPTVYDLAAAYVVGLARNHAFVDGNKRTAIVTAMLFLALNGHRMTATDGALYLFTMSVAAGEIGEAGAVAFFEEHSMPIGPT